VDVEMRIWSVVPILIFLLVGGINTVQALVEEEYNFFVDLKSVNPNFGNGPNANASDPCSWRGVNCSIDGNHVISM
jgi:hypothetical protein